MSDQSLRVSGRIALGSRVRGRNHWTDERVGGVVEKLERSDLDGKVYVTVRSYRGKEQLAIISDLALEPIHCRRPELIPAGLGAKTHYVPDEQDSGYRCANCGHSIWFIRDGRAPGGERLTHDAALAESPTHGF